MNDKKVGYAFTWLTTEGKQMFGGWILENDFNVGTFPQKVASGFSQAFEGLLGASYEPVMYLGHQLVNGTNHAILCKQTLIVKDPTEHLVKVILHEKPVDAGKSEFSILEIVTIL